MSLYAEYISEREGKHIVEDEFGFATYSFVEHLNAVYIEEVFVLPQFRQTGIGASYVSRISELAKSSNYENVITSVSPKAKGATTSLKAILGVGFQLDSMDANLIYFKKSTKD